LDFRFSTEIQNRKSQMHYFHVPSRQISGNHVKIAGRELHHLVNVVRLREGDEIIVLDGSGGVYEVILTSCSSSRGMRDSSHCEVAIGEIRTRRQWQPPLVEVTLFVGLPKVGKMDMIVQKATELGAHRIVPVLCQHIVPRLSAERKQQRVARWRQIAVEASKQSHRPFFPFVSDILDFDEALADWSHSDVKLIFVTPASSSEVRRIFPMIPVAPERLKDVLKQNPKARKVHIFIGPEGGFAEDEIRRALSAGAAPVSLGGNILRTETAAIAALSIILYEKDVAYNDWGDPALDT
jgi:16S rRNA (uracil1498-N3)-methyltransferase